MRKVTLLLIFAFFNVSCNKSKEIKVSDSVKIEKTQNSKFIFTSQDSITNFLISASIADFHKQSGLSNLQFRNSHLGYKTRETGDKMFLLCGEFKSDSNKNWISFATIKTSGYEQWQGSQALSFCNDSTVVWDYKKDLSQLIQKKVVL